MIVNKTFEPFFKDNSEIVCLFGGRGSGKSYAAAQKIVTRMLSEIPHKFLVVHKYERKLKSTVYDQIKEVIYNEGLEDDFTFTISPLEIRCNINENKIMFFGLDGGKIKSITGITSVWIEEATFITEEDWKELYLSIRGEHKHTQQIILSYNPVDIKHWINKRFHIDKIYKASIYHSTYKDNPFVGDNYEVKLESHKHDLPYYKMAKFGEWASISEATVFRNWEVYSPEEHDGVSTDIGEYDSVTAGLDWGAVHNSCCLIIAKQNNRIIVLEEIYVKGFTNNEFISEIRSKNYGSHFIYYADSAEPARIKEFRQNNFNIISVKKGKGSVKYALDYLKRFQIIIMPKCKNLIREISTYSYKYDEKTGTIYDIPAERQEDDAIASLRYAVNGYIPRKSSELKAVQAL